MGLRAIPQTTPVVIQQRIVSGQAFNGSLPVADPVVDLSNALYKYAAPADSVAGLFVWDTREPIVVTQLLIDLGGSGNATVKVVNIDPTTINNAAPTILAGEAVTVAAASAVLLLSLNETNFRVTLLPFQGIQLVTSNSSAAQIVQCTAYIARSRQW